MVRSVLPGIAWPGIPSPSAARLLALQFQFERTQWLAPDALHRRQLGQLQRVLEHAARTVPFYTERFRAHGYDPARDGRDAFHRLPPLTRRDIQEHGARLVSSATPRDHGELFQNLSSGSTGEPVRVTSTGLNDLFWRALLLREHLWQRRDFSGKLCVIRSRLPEVNLPTWGPPVDEVFATGPSASLNIRRPLDEQLAWLREQDCDCLVTHPTNARELARLSLKLGARLPRLGEVRTLGEVLDPELRALCREAWGARVTDTYSSEETGYIALQCPQGEHYHVQSENLLVEILDAQGRPCPPGATGKVVITTLHNFAMPLVRYAIGDYAQPGGACACGRSLPVLTRIHGRQRNMLVLPDGRRFWPSTPFIRYAGIAPLRQMQIVQRTMRRLEARIVAERLLTGSEQAGIVSAIQETLGHPFEVTLLQVAAIERGAGMKHEDFRSDVAEALGN
jgi:phenylacetate-CoA ligase